MSKNKGYGLGLLLGLAGGLGGTSSLSGLFRSSPVDHQRCFLRAIEEADTDLWNRTLSSLGKRPFPDLSCKPTLLKTALKKCVEKEGAARFLARARDTCREPDARALIDNVLFALKADETSDADL